MDPVQGGVLGLVLLFAFLLLGMPIGFALALSGFTGLLFITRLTAAFDSVFTFPYIFASSYMFSVVALFVLCGQLAFASGISSDAYNVGHKLVGRFPGGLALATLFGCAAFAATTGSSIATVATIGKTSIAEMERHGYNRGLATGCTAACGTLAMLIPPSIPMVIYGIVGEQSIGALFIAGIVPGIVSVIMYGLMIIIRTTLNPSLAPRAAAVSWREALASAPKMWGVVLLFLVIIGGIYLGVFTPTEAGAAGSLLAAIMVLTRAKKKLHAFGEAVVTTAKTVGMVFLTLLGASIFAGLIAMSTIPFRFSEYIGALDVPASFILVCFLLMYIVMGCLIEPTPMILITVPILLPVMTKLGYDPIWFGIILVKMCEISMITPPVGINVYVAKAIAPHVPMEEIFRGIGWFFIADCVTVAILVAFPQLSLWLPGLIWVK